MPEESGTEGAGSGAGRSHCVTSTASAPARAVAVPAELALLVVFGFLLISSTSSIVGFGAQTTAKSPNHEKSRGLFQILIGRKKH